MSLSSLRLADVEPSKDSYCPFKSIQLYIQILRASNYTLSPGVTCADIYSARERRAGSFSTNDKSINLGASAGKAIPYAGKGYERDIMRVLS